MSFFFSMILPLPRSTLFPYTTLFRSEAMAASGIAYTGGTGEDYAITGRNAVVLESLEADRKSTRLNSSHSQISYAVFCLKKKTITLSAILSALHRANASYSLRRHPRT